MKIIDKMREGAFEARMARLDLAENWTPLLHYIHVKALLVGFVLGIATFICPITIWLVLT